MFRILIAKRSDSIKTKIKYLDITRTRRNRILQIKI